MVITSSSLAVWFTRLACVPRSAHIRTLLRDRHVLPTPRIISGFIQAVFLSDKLSENQTLQLSYTRRVSRPRDRQISPFLDTSDPYNYQQGTPI
jgi:hypothetical protein